MISLANSEISFGKGDVSIGLSVTGTREDPSVRLVLQNQEGQRISPLPGDYEFKDEEIQNTKLMPQSFFLTFGNKESIDVLISVLEFAKKSFYGAQSKFDIMFDHYDKCRVQEQ